MDGAKSVSSGEIVARIRAHSPFLTNLLDRESELAGDLEAALADPRAAARVSDDLPEGRRLRLERRRLALLLAVGDLSGRYDLTRVTRTLSDFADEAVDRAIRAAIRERSPDAELLGFAAIGLGKLGSRELNYSSDIDPILIFDPETLPRKPREEPVEAAVRIGRRVVELLQSRDADGYVLRVDLRLRPSPEATPIVLPVEAAISYYESQALPWERAAFIRSRACGGDPALGDYFLEAIRPFVWRRALDFGAIGEIHDISRRIRDHHAQGQAFGPGYDLKRGRGGIREVEFYAQIHQLIHGGRDPALRVPDTRTALAALAGAGWIDPGDAEALAAAYTHLRTIEHRLQMVDDRQTHSLPADPAALENVAALHGVDTETLIASIRPHVERVGRVYDNLAGDGSARLSGDMDSLEQRLAEAGFPDPANALRLIETWRGGGYPALRTPAAREALESLLPGLVQAMGEAPDPAHAIARFDAMLAKLPSAINFFRLLEAQPALARLMGTILCHAPTLADALGRRAELLDGLIDATALKPVADVPDLVAEMRRRERGGDYQWQLDHVRRLVNEKRFALGTQIVAGASDPLTVSAGYARVADAAIETLASATIDEFEAAHGRVPGSELVILALGRLGGQALTHASDLDLILLFTGDHMAESDGAKPLGAVTYYNRLSQRITGALSVPTAAGPLYEVDTRLRPSGAQGPLSVSLDGFRRYQQEDAWTWEHMALTRARPVFGSPEGRAAVSAVIAEVLGGKRPDRDIVAEAGKMREEMAAHKPPKGPLDAKLLDGGLVDLEFAVHTLQLKYRTAFNPHLPDAIDALVREGHLSPGMLTAHDFLTRLLVTLRLVAPDSEPPSPATRPLVARAVGVGSWEDVVAELDRVRQEVRTCWGAIRARG
ncbi:bifunctional [glutamine synthetase] adenylyltransferase/[glutamine synthetase]-adenylyl-L-tyrosine phosphorylase [Sphingomonas sp. G-3-2-10]|uniref:bifunctional [glutamine synthetase] adenylyltransferase/[glutamine synthetase]-adenylyl-L-tyrosine phosphorylase n=1 Tax=Sphingomonas sp. G-3-2-10 TaxID=2728838 RepID=UPI00146E8766|nr:bifunctional [glutamine synthetase] adenylyltransferase/[glutamine synthetase]-adenylyl-L-tyrosine phosphorylase [Sphingomonas sp. G-3-2-10]NML05523.1 bifunctional [glutamine synthetase] adenylyltransferase/[glutamine synthetase]-adenylyl-L-tyrosine phosphorylase [Sphingomonas sp. G-3-2-10]